MGGLGGVGVGVGVGITLGVGDGLGVGVRVGVAVTTGVGVGVGFVSSPPQPIDRDTTTSSDRSTTARTLWLLFIVPYLLIALYSPCLGIGFLHYYTYSSRISQGERAQLKAIKSITANVD